MTLAKGTVVRMSAAFKAESPENPSEWISEFRKEFGTTQATAPTSPQPTNNVPAQGQQPGDPSMTRFPPQSNDAGAPSMLPVWERPSDPFKWTEDQYSALVAKVGVREAQRIARKKAEEFAPSMRLQVTTRR